MWRPEGWKNPHEIEYKPGVNSAVDVAEGLAYEAGADAMYEPAYQKGRKDEREELKASGALIADLCEIQCWGLNEKREHQFLLWKANVAGTFRGRLVFIPDE